MPTSRIDIENYTLRVARNSQVPWTSIAISGPVLSHGIQHTATLHFNSNYQELFGLVRNVGGLNFDGMNAMVMIPLGDFDRMYDVLRNEDPLKLYLAYSSEPFGNTETTRTLTNIAIETGEESTGEGAEPPQSIQDLRTMITSLETTTT